MKRKKFTTDFKKNAVLQAQQPGISKTHVAKSLGVSTITLSRWVREAQEAPTNHIHTGISKAEYDSLLSELEKMTTERNLLKQALSLFISDMK